MVSISNSLVENFYCEGLIQMWFWGPKNSTVLHLGSLPLSIFQDFQSLGMSRLINLKNRLGSWSHICLYLLSIDMHWNQIDIQYLLNIGYIPSLIYSRQLRYGIYQGRCFWMMKNYIVIVIFHVLQRFLVIGVAMYQNIDLFSRIFSNNLSTFTN